MIPSKRHRDTCCL